MRMRDEPVLLRVRLRRVTSAPYCSEPHDMKMLRSQAVLDVQVFAADNFREPTGNAAPAPRRLVYVQTMGCQMNVNDSEARIGFVTSYSCLNCIYRQVVVPWCQRQALSSSIAEWGTPQLLTVRTPRICSANHLLARAGGPVHPA